MLMLMLTADDVAAASKERNPVIDGWRRSAAVMR